MLCARWAARRSKPLCFPRYHSPTWPLRPSYSTSSPTPKLKSASDKINYNTELSFDDRPELLAYPHVTANDLESHQQPPTCVKMLVRDFIEDSLYNPNYGYFSKQATILTAPGPQFDFQRIRDVNELHAQVGKAYAEYDVKRDGPGKQVWHTPTELFKPWYGQAIAQCLVSEYLLKYFPYDDFVIYEIGAGNGSLAVDILDFIRDRHPEVYDRTRYTIVEISAKLAKLQRKKLRDKHPVANVVNKSIFHWRQREPSPCFVLAMEVVDNFAHDMIRYDTRTLEPYQAFITVDDNGDFATHYTRTTDPLISSLLSIRNRLGHQPGVPSYLKSRVLRSIYTSLPFAPNLSKPEYIPTRMLSLLTTLRNSFPLHRLLLSDFSSLPDTIPGHCSPVVQTRYQNSTVPCSTLLVKPGYFDIFFPTDFEQLRDMYEFVLAQPQPGDLLSDSSPRASPLMTTVSPPSLGAGFFTSSRPHNRRQPTPGLASASGLPVGQRKSSVFMHAEFLETYADLEKTRLLSGENPMLDFYKNVKILF